MTPEVFKTWRKTMKLSQQKAAVALGISKSSIEAYEAGVWRATGKPVEIPLAIALACSAIYHKFGPWGSGPE